MKTIIRIQKNDKNYLTSSQNDNNDLVFLTNTPTQAEFLPHSLKQVERGIGLYMNIDKTEFMCFNQDGVISEFNGKPLKLVDQFTYLGSNISSTESDVNIGISKVWTAIERLSIIWKFDHCRQNVNSSKFSSYQY